jgi:hypothetical protein
MTIKTPEDDEFDRIARESGWRKQQVATQASLQEKYEEAIYLLREAQHALNSCASDEDDNTGKMWYYFNVDLVQETTKNIEDYLKQNG